MSKCVSVCGYACVWECLRILVYEFGDVMHTRKRVHTVCVCICVCLFMFCMVNLAPLPLECAVNLASLPFKTCMVSFCYGACCLVRIRRLPKLHEL